MLNRGHKCCCNVCGCKFYDLNRPEPKCPHCGITYHREENKNLVSVEAVNADKSAALLNVSQDFDSEIEMDDTLWDNLDDFEDI